MMHHGNMGRGVKSRKEKEAKIMATPPTRVVTDCRHGKPVVDQDRLSVVQGYIERMDKHQVDFKGAEFDEKNILATFEMLMQFWSEPKHARHIDADMVRYWFACATEQVLKGNMALSRRFSFLGSYLATWFKLGKDTFLGMISNIPTNQIMVDFHASIRILGTDRGLVLFLAKQIPCSCLDEDKKNAKQAPKSGRCWYCNREVLRVELKKCSQCKSAVYCSKECQAADWRREHKKKCKSLVRYCEQIAAVKTQSHC
jgi:hypothetical protein